MKVIDKQIDYFLKKGIVASLRELPYKIDREVLLNEKHKGKVIKIISNPNFRQLQAHQKLSGFGNTKEWIEATKIINDGNKPQFLVVIEKLKENIKN